MLSSVALQVCADYERLIGKALASHERNRNPEGITDQDVARARLYSSDFSGAVDLPSPAMPTICTAGSG